MLMDMIYYRYLKFTQKINDFIKRNKKSKNKKNHTIFSTAALALLIFWWLLVGIKVVKGTNTSSHDTIVDAFGSMIYTSVQSSINGFGKYGECTMTDSAKEMILKDLADAIEINQYQITDIVDEEGNNVKTLSQLSKNGDVIIKFLTKNQIEQYIYVQINLNNNFDSAYTYERIIKEFANDINMENIIVHVNLLGKVNGNLSTENREKLARDMIDNSNAKLIFENCEDELFTIYGYNKNIKEYVNIGKEKVNVNVSVTYDENENRTCFHLSTPIINVDY